MLKQTMCPECGAPAVDDRDCRLMLAEVIGWEWGDPALGARHFRTVAGHNLQHPAQFTEEAVDGLRAAFIEHLDAALPVDAIRRRHARSYGGRRRVLKPAPDRRPILRAWPMTIADVYRAGRASAADRVLTWAWSIRSRL